MYKIDVDLTINETVGMAWQTDMSVTEEYGEDYFNKCLSYRGTEIADALNVCRAALVARHYQGILVDVGIGSGEFIKHRPRTLGMDINPAAIRWLRHNNKLAADYVKYPAYSFWDVIEHMPEPEKMLIDMPHGCFAFFSIPVFDDLNKIRDSKHYRPGEHLYYWTKAGFVDWVESYGFDLLEINEDETSAGRESIASFAFVKHG